MVVILDLDNSAGQIRPGMNATVEIKVGILRDVLSVPLPALDSSGDRHFVWKVTPDGPVAVKVALGGHNLTHVEILSGLQQGDRIHLIRPTGARLPEAAQICVIAHPGYTELARFELRWIRHRIRNRDPHPRELGPADAIVSPRALDALTRLPELRRIPRALSACARRALGARSRRESASGEKFATPSARQPR